MAFENPKIREWAKKRAIRAKMRLLIRPCNGMCDTPGYHTHDLTAFGKWHFVWRYRLQDLIFQDPRPQPPINEEDGAPWIEEYQADWKQEFPGYEPPSCFIREQSGYWVWVTNTPQFDRNWFDEKGWRFPVSWITVPSQQFYQVGKDELSTVVSLPPRESVEAE